MILLPSEQIDDYKQARQHENLKNYVSKMLGKEEKKEEEEAESKVRTWLPSFAELKFSLIKIAFSILFAVLKKTVSQWSGSK